MDDHQTRMENEKRSMASRPERKLEEDRGQFKGFYDWSRDLQVGVEEGENEEEGEEEEECLTPVRQVYENPLDRCIVIRILKIFF